MLPEAEKCPILVIQWSDKALKSEIVGMVKKELEKNGILFFPNTAVNTLLLTASQESLEKQAEIERLVKERRLSPDETIMDHFQIVNRSQFLVPSSPGRDPRGLFTTNERCQLMLDMLENVTISDEKLKDILVEHKYKGNSSNLRYVLESHKWINTLAPLHFDEKKVEILKSTMSWTIMPPIDRIQDYYGPEVAYYFAFVGFLAQWAGVLGILGLSCFLFRLYRNDTIDEDEYTPFYGIFCFIWAVLFYRFWERRENTLAYQFGNTDLSSDDFEQDDFEESSGSHRRPEFHGKMRTSPVTGKPELYYPSYKRKIHYLVSAIVTVMMLGIAFFMMILSLNLQGYIQPKGDEYQPFFYPNLATLAGKGQLFDAMSSWRCFVPVIIHVVSILTLNTIYKEIAKKLTDWENHASQKSYNNSLILKRFLFEAFDCYVALFYLAFYACDVDRLRIELIAVFNIDTFRRIATEVVVPMILHKVFKSEDDGHPQDLDLDEYESFDDYLEVLISFGYVTLFASAYPLASLIMCVALLVEMRSDCYKLTHLCQKPIVREAVSDIGMWKYLLEFMVWFSCLTNCLLFGFTSDQMMHYVPNFYIRDDAGVTHMVQDKGWIAILIIFALERVLIYFGLSLNILIPKIPEKLMIRQKRRKYLLRTHKKKQE